MALIGCLECKAQISSTAVACPQCGAQIPKAAKWPWIVGIPVGLFTLLLLWGNTIPQYKTDARELRETCEQLVGKANTPRLRECDALYDQKIREGREREDVLAGRKAPPAAPVDLPLSPTDQKRAACADSIETSKKEYAQRMARGEFKTAADEMRTCADLLGDPFLQNMVNKADLKAKQAGAWKLRHLHTAQAPAKRAGASGH